MSPSSIMIDPYCLMDETIDLDPEWLKSSFSWVIWIYIKTYSESVKFKLIVNWYDTILFYSLH